MIAPQLETIARIGATGLTDSIAVGTAIAVLAGTVSFLFRRRSAATRFVVLMIALLATASLPLFRLAMESAAPSEGRTLLHVADSWALWILGAWAVLAVLGLIRVGAGILSLRRLRNSCQPVEPSALAGDVAGIVSAHCPSRRVKLLLSTEATVPAAIGLFHAAVVLPEWVLKEMSPEEIEHVIIHELSHLRRWDDWSNLVQQIVKALFFFHPAVWWMESRLAMEREMACDDAVLRRSQNARGYAECLTRIAERSFLRRGLAMAQAAVSRVRQTSCRVARILQLEKPLGDGQGKIPAVCALVVTIAGIGVVWRTPVLLSFDDSEPKVIAARTKEFATPAPVKAAGHEAQPINPQAKPHIRAVVRRSVPKQEPLLDLQQGFVRANWATDGETVTRSLVVVVMQDGRVAVWHITTWEYSPSQQVRSARKTT